ncbi:MAG: ERCC4 domain-containing protein, partial [Candidatus Nanohaloarchaea archaeon]
GEEGLDIPAVDYVVFYEPIPSEIRTIQRRGRTGRQEEGEVYVLMAEDTRDEAYYWSAKHKEDQMKEVVQGLDTGDASDAVAGGAESDSGGGQRTLDGFDEESGVVVVADDRENTVMKELSRRDVSVRSSRLEVGDFLLSDRTVVERKTAADFVDSIVDNRLFPQLQELVTEFAHPLLVIEGEDLYRHRDVHPNAIRGALSSVALDYDVPILWSSGTEETAELLIAAAKREQEDEGRTVDIRGERSPTTERDRQEFLVAGLPNVSETLAERLLEEFGTAEAVFTASATELQQVEGIGEETADRIRDLLERDYE